MQASSDDGVVRYFDVRNDEPVFTLHAHDQATTGSKTSLPFVWILLYLLDLIVDQ